MNKTNKTAKLGHLRVKPGDKVYIVLRNISRSGMSRRMDFYLFRKGQLLYVTPHVAQITDNRQHSDGTLKVGGCGMDMGFAVVYDLSRKLFPNGFYIGKEDYPRNNSEDIRSSRIDPDGGYALKHVWI